MLQASCNSVDEAGSSPLHLAAWAGHGELVRVLLETGPSVPNVNLTNGDKETSLHCAAQVTNGNTAAGHVTAVLTADWPGPRVPAPEDRGELRLPLRLRGHRHEGHRGHAAGHCAPQSSHWSR